MELPAVNPSEKSAQWIAEAMKAAGISQAELARRMGVDPRYIYKILKGRRGIRVDTLFRMIQACGYDIQALRISPRKAA